MKTSVLGLTLVISALLTVPAAARGGSAGYPGTVGPSYPYPSYCAHCGAWWVVTPPPPSRAVVRPTARARIDLAGQALALHSSCFRALRCTPWVLTDPTGGG